ncbi:hypothetical protein Tco_1378854 [Tanacetum coccineum]
MSARVAKAATYEPLGLGYRALRHRGLALGEVLVPSTFKTPASLEWSPGSLLVLPLSPAGPTPIASPTTTPSVTIIVDEDEFLEVGAQLELYGSILHDHTQRLDALPFALLMSLEQEQERATMTFSALWRPVLALKSWAGHVDARRAKMWQARYDDHRLIHDLLVQNTMMQRELQELRDRVNTLKREGSHRGQ